MTLLLTLLLFATPEVPDLSGVLSLMGRDTAAQACPIAEDKALTNAHVANSGPYIWEALGRTGLIGAERTTVLDRFRDLAYVQPWNSLFPRWYAIAQQAPSVGDTVYFVGFDFRKKDDAFAPRVFKTKIIRIRNGHLLYSPAGVPGTSGSCVLNQAGEVVGINQGGKETEDKNIVGMAVGVWLSMLALGR